MSNKSKKKIIIILIVLFVGILVTLLCVKIADKRKGNNQLTDLERISKVLSTTKPTALFVRGGTVDFNGLVETSSISSIELSEINCEKEYRVIIINDLNDGVYLSDEEIECVKKLISEDNNMLVYLGRKYAATWDDPSTEIANIEGNLCYIYYSWAGHAYRDVGAWRENDQDAVVQYPYMLGETILYSIESYLQ